MSLLHQLNIQAMKQRHGLNVFVETGTGKGDGIAHAWEHNFDRYFSVELFPPLFEHSKNRFKGEPRISILNMKSVDGLVEICKQLKPEDKCMFWMDAHFPGADFNLAQYDSEKDEKIRIPLEDELRKLASIRDVSRDVIVCDDLFLYEDGPFEVGNWPLRSKCGGNGTKFVHEIFGKTHYVMKTYVQTGCILIVPETQTNKGEK